MNCKLILSIHKIVFIDFIDVNLTNLDPSYFELYT